MPGGGGGGGIEPGAAVLTVLQRVYSTFLERLGKRVELLP
jgi:hypothetical protein